MKDKHFYKYINGYYMLSEAFAYILQKGIMVHLRLLRPDKENKKHLG